MDKTKSKTKSLLELALALVLFIVAGYFIKENIECNNVILGFENKNEELRQIIHNQENKIEETQLLIDKLQKEVDYNNELAQECQTNKDIFFNNILVLEEKILNGESKARIAYLTIDDGPNIKTTKQWLEILKNYDVLATFFVNKKEECTEEYQAMLKDYHVLANHTASHVFTGTQGVYDSSDNMIQDLKENYDYIYNNYGVKLKLMRFPGGSGEIQYLGQDKTEFVSKVKEAGYGYVDWNVSSGDGRRGQEVMTYVNNVLDNAYYVKIATVLMHDDSVNTIAALPQIIEGLQKMGFILLPLQIDSSVVK